ncbi:hypothetical protein [Deinococcus soli (ex Cha et al. 2016)]|uniref:hypothetical protein n=1 Tax=Deinococcus soli (ex Cha et al. 2016) TaxID=1309411 RepID=UPI00166B32BC|nr:hypothetical protein [Deinococcus soli (ex Cha et al. 2016)]GGB59069.1 hypothetical protein GCM10008019_13770 [Deinococcus soli (ex Cha et al. 2016)]
MHRPLLPILLVSLLCGAVSAASAPTVQSVLGAGQRWQVTVEKNQAAPAALNLKESITIPGIGLLLQTSNRQQGVLYSIGNVKSSPAVPEHLRVEWMGAATPYQLCVILRPSGQTTLKAFSGFAFHTLNEANAYLSRGTPGDAPRCTFTRVK